MVINKSLCNWLNGYIMKFTSQKSVLMTDIDSLGRLKISSALALCQELANEQAMEMKIDNASLEGKFAWVLSRIYLNVTQELNTSCLVDVTTFPCQSRGVSYPRQYIISREGKTLYEVHSDWTVINLADRKIVRAGEVPRYADFTEDGIPHLMAAPKIRANTEGMTEVGQVTVGRSMLDILGHVNNTKYMDIVTDYLSEEQYAQGIESINITYIKEALLGDNIKIYAKYDDGDLLMMGVKNDDENCFAVKIKFAERSI